MQKDPILQKSIPYDTEVDRRLPGVTPVVPGHWLDVDDAYSAQIALKTALLARQKSDVIMLDPSAQEMAQELLSTALSEVVTHHGFSVSDQQVQCPDGRVVRLDEDDPLGSLAQLVQEDFCILVKRGTEHVLIGALLGFPASWTLSEKFGKPLMAIHGPVDAYDDLIAKRVQRLFDGVRPGRPLWRFNVLHYAKADLYHPRLEAEPRLDDALPRPFLRSERQTILRLPKTKAVVFSIHTYVVQREGSESNS